MPDARIRDRIYMSSGMIIDILETDSGAIYEIQERTIDNDRPVLPLFPVYDTERIDKYYAVWSTKTDFKHYRGSFETLEKARDYVNDQ